MELIVRKFKSDTSRDFQDDIYKFNTKTSNFEPTLPEELRTFRKSIEEIIFLTGNKNKLNEFRESVHLKGMKLTCPQQKIDLAEIQDSSILNIVQDKCQRAREHILEGHGHESEASSGSNNNMVILVEDTCLNFEALNGMPGPYVKWFLEAIGPEGLFRMLTGYPNKAADAICIYALMDLYNDSSQPDERTILFFKGVARGQIVEPRRGSTTSGWGWDPIFEEERSRLTFAEMEPEVKSKFSHRSCALELLRAFLEEI